MPEEQDTRIEDLVGEAEHITEMLVSLTEQHEEVGAQLRRLGLVRDTLVAAAAALKGESPLLPFPTAE